MKIAFVYPHLRDNGTYRVRVTVHVDGTKFDKNTTFQCDPRLTPEENLEAAYEVGKKYKEQLAKEYWEEKAKRTPTLSYFFHEVYVNEVATRRADTTAELYVNVIKKHFLNTFGNFKLREITKEMLQYKIDHFVDEVNEEAEDPKSLKSQTIKRYVSGFRSVFDLAVEKGLLEGDPFGYMHYRKIYRPFIKCMDKADYKKVLAYLTEKLATNKLNRTDVIIAIAIMAGLRRGEIVALQWGAIENLMEDRLDRCQICVAATAYKVKGKPQQRDNPKTVASKRAFVIPELLGKILLSWKEACSKNGPVASTDFLFPGKANGMTNINGPSRWVKAFFEEFGLPGIKLHSLRHTFASVLYYTNKRRDEIQRLMGHEDPETTEIYLYAFENLDKVLMTEVNDFHATLLKD